MLKEQPTKIDIVKIQMVRDRTLDYAKKTIRGPQDLAELGQKFIQNADREVFLLFRGCHRHQDNPEDDNGVQDEKKG